MDTVAAYIEANEQRYVEELIEYVKIPSVSTKVEAREDMERTCRFLFERMKEAGLENVVILPTSGHASLYGDWLHAPGKPTVLVYGHYDVQPPEPLELWDSPPSTRRFERDSFTAAGPSTTKDSTIST